MHTITLWASIFYTTSSSGSLASSNPVDYKSKLIMIVFEFLPRFGTEVRLGGRIFAVVVVIRPVCIAMTFFTSYTRLHAGRTG